MTSLAGAAADEVDPLSNEDFEGKSLIELLQNVEWSVSRFRDYIFADPHFRIPSIRFPGRQRVGGHPAPRYR